MLFLSSFYASMTFNFHMMLNIDGFENNSPPTSESVIKDIYYCLIEIIKGFADKGQF